MLSNILCSLFTLSNRVEIHLPWIRCHCNDLYVRHNLNFEHGLDVENPIRIEMVHYYRVYHFGRNNEMDICAIENQVIIHGINWVGNPAFLLTMTMTIELRFSLFGLMIFRHQ